MPCTDGPGVGDLSPIPPAPWPLAPWPGRGPVPVPLCLPYPLATPRPSPPLPRPANPLAPLALLVPFVFLKKSTFFVIYPLCSPLDRCYSPLSRERERAAAEGVPPGAAPGHTIREEPTHDQDD